MTQNEVKFKPFNLFHIGFFPPEIERSIIRKRINAGLARARSNGKRLGRPWVDESVEQPIRDSLSRRDKEIRKIAQELGVGVSVVQRVKMKGVVG